MDESKPSKYLVYSRIGLAVIVGLVAIVALWRWIDDPPNADPRQGRAYIHKYNGWTNDNYEHYKVCVGPHLYEVYDDPYNDKLDREVKTSYADVCKP